MLATSHSFGLSPYWGQEQSVGRLNILINQGSNEACRASARVSYRPPLPRAPTLPDSSSLYFVDKLSRVIAIVAVPDLLARSIVTYQDVELASLVSFGNRNVIWLTLATEVQSI